MIKAEDKDKEIVRRWSMNPDLWVQDIFSEAIASGDLRLSFQQREGLRELGKIIRAKKKVEEKKPLTEEEQRYASKFGLSIMSGNGTGKDTFAAICILFFLYCFPDVKIPATANSARQLRNVLWAEVRKWMRLANRLETGNPGSESILEHLFTWQAEKIFYTPMEGAGWFAEAVTINTKASDTEQAEGIAGRHERFMLIVVDEASGIAEAVFNKFEATMTSPMNIALLIFNPTRSKGYAISSQTSPHWVALRWNAEESELVGKDQIQRLADKYGRDSTPYRIRVLGLPPIADTDTLIPMDWIQDAIGRDIQDDGPIMKGVDVGAGGDKSVILTRMGGKVTQISRHSTKDTMTLVGYVSQEMMEDEPDGVFIDIIGIGKGVYDRLREVGKRVRAVDVRRTAQNEQRFQRLRDELWWKCREMFEQGTISIPDDKELIDQLSAIKYDIDSNGKVKIESKKEMKGHGIGSPDEADALCLTFVLNDAIFRKDSQIIDRYEQARKRQKSGDLSYMAV